MTTATVQQPGKLVSMHDSLKPIIHFEHLTMELAALSPTTMRARISFGQPLGPDESYAIETIPHALPATLSRTSHDLTFSTGKAALRITVATGAISLLDSQGNVLSQGEALSYRDTKVQDRRLAREDEDFFGLGEKMTPLGRRGYTVGFWNTDNPNHHTESDTEAYCSMPFMVALGKTSGSCWGYFLDSPYHSAFHLGVNRWEELDMEVFNHECALYFFAGATPADLLQEYTALTGHHALPPLWALGNHQCRWSYMSTGETRAIAQEYRSRKIPCDAIWFDIDYMDGYRVFTFDTDRFADMKEHCAWLTEQGFAKVVIVDPGVKVDEPGRYGVYDKGKELGYYVKRPDGTDFEGRVWPGATAFPDFTLPQARKWWGEQHQSYYAAGIDGFWNDMNEPADWTKPESKDLIASDNGRDSTFDKIHNVYALLMAKATVQDGCLKQFPDKRPFLLTRAAYAGIQKYSAKWGGDNRSTWAHLKGSLAQVINMGLSGVGFFGVDIGGFGDNTTPELLARWTQAGALYPFCRNHCAIGCSNQEPWRFGEQIESICRDAITLRYRYIPYLYQLFYQMHTSGAPVMRPLFWEFGSDPRTYTCTDQFMIGSHLLVAPVVERGAVNRQVYLPAGEWYQHGTFKRFSGPGDFIVNAPLDTLPLFYRGSSIIPTTEPVQSTAFIDKSHLELEIIAGTAPCAISVYEDDMTSNAYLKGEHLFNQISLDGSQLSIALAKGTRYRSLSVRVLHEKKGWSTQEYPDSIPGQIKLSV